MKLENATKEQLLEVVKAALALSIKMVDTEELLLDKNNHHYRSSFDIEKEWEDLTAAFMEIK